MMHDSLVRNQYETWIYPEPIEELEPFFRGGRFLLGDPSRYADLYWPDKTCGDDLSILVAGCGANEAALYAYGNRDKKVIGVDLSKASLAHEEKLKYRYQLDNLELHELPIQEIEKLDQDFDLIISSGVLHHTIDPVASLASLKNVLKTDGVIKLMLYAQYGRVGVYQLQEFFALIGLEQDEKSLDIVDFTLDKLSEHHYVQSYIKNSDDLDYRSGVVDTFLHKQDRAYTVQGCLDFVEAAEMEFVGWFNNRPYYPEAVLDSSSKLYEKLNALPEKALWKAMELFNGRIAKHEFMVCRKDRPGDGWRIETTDDSISSLIPIFFPAKLSMTDMSTQQCSLSNLAYPDIAPISLSATQSRLALCVNGENSVAECARLAGLSKEQESIAKTFFRSLWRLGLLTFRSTARKNR